MKLKRKHIPIIVSALFYIISLFTFRWILKSQDHFLWIVAAIVISAVLATFVEQFLEKKFNPKPVLLSFYHVSYPDTIYKILIIDKKCTVYNDTMTTLYRIYDVNQFWYFVNNDIWILKK